MIFDTDEGHFTGCQNGKCGQGLLGRDLHDVDGWLCLERRLRGYYTHYLCRTNPSHDVATHACELRLQDLPGLTKQRPPNFF